MCIFESATVKSESSMQKNYEIFNTDCWFTLLDLLLVLEILNINKAQTMTSLLVIWSLSELFFRPLDPKSEKKIPINQIIKKFWPKNKFGV